MTGLNEENKLIKLLYSRYNSNFIDFIKNVSTLINFKEVQQSKKVNLITYDFIEVDSCHQMYRACVDLAGHEYAAAQYKMVQQGWALQSFGGLQEFMPFVLAK